MFNFRTGNNKYGNTKIRDDGFVFDSIVEHQYYLVLKHRQAAGEIFNLTLKPKFPLVVHGVAIVERAFRPDFAYMDRPVEEYGMLHGVLEDFGWTAGSSMTELFQGDLHVVDTKGYLDPSDPATRIFNMNKKLVKALYDIEIEIIQTPQAERRQAARKVKKATERSLLRRAMKGTL